MQAAQATLRQSHATTELFSHASDASRTGYAEAKAVMNELMDTIKDASRTGYAEAKNAGRIYCEDNGDASRTGYAEAKIATVAGWKTVERCKPHRLR